MKTESIVLLFTASALLLNVIYYAIRLYYVRKRIEELEKQTKLMRLE